MVKMMTVYMFKKDYSVKDHEFRAKEAAIRVTC